jgi:type IV pilus assembly protein PilX
MNNKITGSSSCVREKGATLIVSLVILAVITVLGVASMRSSNLELKMAASARDRAVAMQAAEAAMAVVEKRLARNFGVDFPSLYSPNSFIESCDVATSNCFKPECPNGLCFSGDLKAAIVKDDCGLAFKAPPAAPPDIDGKVVVRQHWKEEALWNLSIDVPVAGRPPGFVDVVVGTNGTNQRQTSVRYLVEFLCFVPKDENAVADEDHSRNSGVPLFQVTVRAEGEAGRSTVMVQSVFRGAR